MRKLRLVPALLCLASVAGTLHAQPTKQPQPVTLNLVLDKSTATLMLQGGQLTVELVESGVKVSIQGVAILTSHDPAANAMELTNPTSIIRGNPASRGEMVELTAERGAPTRR